MRLRYRRRKKGKWLFTSKYNAKMSFCMCIGLKDNEGNDIYENDIVEFVYKMSNINKAIDEVFEVLNNYGYQDNAAFKRNFRRQLENISVVTKREIEIDIKKVFDNHKIFRQGNI